MRPNNRCSLRETQHGPSGEAATRWACLVCLEDTEPDAEFRIRPRVFIDAQLGGIEAEHERQVFELSNLDLIGVCLRLIHDCATDLRGRCELILRDSQRLALVAKRALDRSAVGEQDSGQALVDFGDHVGPVRLKNLAFGKSAACCRTPRLVSCELVLAAYEQPCGGHAHASTADRGSRL